MKQNYRLALIAIFILTLFSCKEPPVDDPNTCMHTVNYWMWHSNEWQADRLSLGGSYNDYTKEEALRILATPANGNHLVSLAKEMIALKLNFANGVRCESMRLIMETGEDAMLVFSNQRGRVPPIGTAYNNHPDIEEHILRYRNRNEGNMPADCCKGLLGK